MSSLHHAQIYNRTSPPHPAHVRKTSAAAKPSRSAPSTPKITLKAAKTKKQAKEKEDVDVDEDLFQFDDDMNTSFLQFCAMCDKQILVPNSSILYCSASCRQRDTSPPSTMNSSLPLASPTRTGPFLPPLKASSSADPFEARIPTYVPRMQPTPRSLPTYARKPPTHHEGKSDLDPTEWKPAEAASTQKTATTKNQGGKEWKPKIPHRPSSEAFTYLSQFHRSSDSLASKRRPVIRHGKSEGGTGPTPSLSHTPSASTSSDSLASTPELIASLPVISNTDAGERLAMAKDGGLTYEKKVVGSSLGNSTGSLKKLLGTTGRGI